MVGALCALGSAMSWSVTSLMVRSLSPAIGTFTINAARTTLTAAGDTIFFESTQRLGLGRAMTISMSYPVVAASLAALLLGERLTAPRVPLDEIDPLSAQAVRLPVGALMLWVTPWARRGLPALMRGGWRLFGQLLALAALTAVSSVMYGASVKYAGVAVATVLSSTAPLFAVPLGIVFLGERLPVLAMLGAAVTVAGMVVLRL
jgi:drug/metabolite transporter (DMT)-like permease